MSAEKLAQLEPLIDIETVMSVRDILRAECTGEVAVVKMTTPIMLQIVAMLDYGYYNWQMRHQGLN